MRSLSALLCVWLPLINRKYTVVKGKHTVVIYFNVVSVFRSILALAEMKTSFVSVHCSSVPSGILPVLYQPLQIKTRGSAGCRMLK